MKRKLLLSLSLLSIPLMANANGVSQFTLINGSPSLLYPSVEVESGYISYYFVNPGNSGCPTYDNPTKVDLTNVPFKIFKTGQQPTTYTFNLPPKMDACFADNMAAVFLYITNVDGIPKSTAPYQNCAAVAYLQSKNDVGHAGLEIQKTSSISFSCFDVSGATKK